MTLKQRISGFAALLGLLCTVAVAQPAPQDPNAPQTPPKSHEEVHNMKIAFFTDALQLTSKESQEFWPLYNQYWSERRAVSSRRRELYKKIRTGTATEAQLKELTAVATAETQLNEKYIAIFKTVLPVNKVARVFVADEDFKNYLTRMVANTRRE